MERQPAFKNGVAKEQYVKKALYEENLDEKEFPVDQALQLIGCWKTRISP